MADEPYEFAVFDDSDEEQDYNSSEDEIDIMLHGTPEQKRRIMEGKNAESSDDEFEKDMMQELERTVANLEKDRIPVVDEPVAMDMGANKDIPEQSQQYYDDLYFDSDDECDDETGDSKSADSASKKKSEKKKHPVLSNDDLFYDPDLDDEDQKWMDDQRRSYLSTGKCVSQGADVSSSVPSQEKLPTSDAVLNCPACMTMLCMDCQRHEIYKNQYRAMFVFNCSLDITQTLHCPLKNKKRRKPKQHTGEGSSAGTDSADIYHPVKCNICRTEVAVCDKDEVYHFFNVLASYS